MESLPIMEAALGETIRFIRFVTEAIGAFWIAIGVIYATSELVTMHVRRQTLTFTPIRLTFSRYLSLGLEFQLASDILSTAVAPSWTEVGKLAATAAIRTALNYSLTREIREYRERETPDDPRVAAAEPAVARV